MSGDKAYRKALLTVKRLNRDTGGDARLKGAIDNFGQQRQQRFNQPANGSQSAALGLDTNYANPPQLLVAEPPQQQRNNNQGMAAQTADLGSAVDDGIGMLTGRSDAKPAPAKGAPAAATPAPQGQPNHPATATPPSKDQQGAAFNMIDRLVNVHGWTPEAASIAAGNAMQESSFNPAAGGDPSIPGGSHGMFQWNRDRLTNLQNYAQQQGTSWQDPNTQTDFFAQEAKKMVPSWPSQTDLSQAKPISKAYEGYGIEGNRVPDAQYIYKAYQNRPQPAPTGPVSSADIPQDDTVPQAKRGGFMRRKKFDDGGSSGDGGDGGDGNGGDGDSSGDSAGDSAATAAGTAAGFGGVGDASGAPAGTSTDSGVTGFGGVGDDSATNGVNGSVGIGSPNGAPNGVSVGYGNTGNNGTGNAAGVGPGAGGVGSGAAGAGGGTSGGATGGGAGTASGGSGVNDTLNAYLQMRGLGDYGVASLGVPPGLLSGVNTAVSPVSTAGISAPTYNAAVISAVNAQMNGQSPYGTPAYNAAVNALKGVNGNTGFGGGSATAQGPGTTGFNSTPTGAEGVSTAGLGQSAGPSAATSAPAAPNNPYSSPGYAAAVAALKSGAGAPGPGPGATQVAGLGTPSPAPAQQTQQQQAAPPGQTSAPATNGNNGNSSVGGRYGYSAPVSAQRSHGGTVVKRASGGIASMPTNEMVAKAMQIIARHKAATGGKQTTAAASAPATSSNSPASQAYQPSTQGGAGNELMNIFSGYTANGAPDIPGDAAASPLIGADFGEALPGSSGAAPAAAAPAAPITPALAGQNIGNASGATGAPLGITPMASPTGGQGMPGSPSAASGTPTYSNTLNEALGTNSPTSNQVFGFNYPVPPPSQPQPQGPVSQAQINAEYGVGDGSQIGTGVFAAGGAIIMDALTRANSRARKAKGKR